ncbi:MAG TPA: hypothetical protein ENH85_14535 [Candidatus Scalindua sp.]|nr:hypothetical protein [Candidatus Scalindua sp.]
MEFINIGKAYYIKRKDITKIIQWAGSKTCHVYFREGDKEREVQSDLTAEELIKKFEWQEL